MTGSARRLLAAALTAAALAGCSSGGTPPVAPVLGQRGVRLVGGGGALPEQLLEPPVVTAAQRQLAKNKRVGRLCDALQTLDDLPEPADDVADLSDYAAQVHGILSSIDFSKKLDDAHGKARIGVPSEVVDVLTDMQAHAYAYMIRLNAVNGVRADMLKRSAQLHVTRQQIDAMLAPVADRALVQLLNSSHTADERLLEQARPTLCLTQV